jgi:hypothetical protein
MKLNIPQILNDINNKVIKQTEVKNDINLKKWKKKLTSFDTSKTPSWIFLYMVPAVFMNACKRIGYVKFFIYSVDDYAKHST